MIDGPQDGQLIHQCLTLILTMFCQMNNFHNKIYEYFNIKYYYFETALCQVEVAL